MIKTSAVSTKKYLFGFTLIEILIYLSIFLIVTTASITFVISLDNFIDQYRLETMLYRSGTNVMEQVLLAVRQADTVDFFNLVEDDPNNGKLGVENTLNSTIFTYIDGRLELEIDGFNYGDLTGDDVSVDDFTVYYYSVANIQFIRVRISLTATLDALTSKSETFYGAGVIRGAI